MNTKRFLTSGFVGTALLLGAVAPAFAATDISIAGNGKDSNNRVDLTQTCRSTTTQRNNSTANIGVNVKQNSGNNRANGTTGGNVNITTGNNAATTTVTVGGSSNDLTSADCCCGAAEDLMVAVEDNGADSTNRVNSTTRTTSRKTQRNRSLTDVKHDATQRTGRNRANNGTTGDVEITTGDTTNDVTVDVTAPSNTVQ